jgi:hypothetical protein
MISRHLDGRFDGFRPGISEINFLCLFAGSHSCKPLREGHETLIIKIRAGNVDQLGSLFLNRFDHVRMAMPSRNYCNAGGKIQEHVAIDILHHRATPRFRHQGVTSGVGGRYELRIPCDHAFCFGARKRRQQSWQLGFTRHGAH